MGVSGASGMVQADFKIDVPADNADQVVERISSSTPEADSKILAGEIAAAGLSAKYPETKVVMISASTNPCDTTPGPENPCDAIPSTCFSKLAKIRSPTSRMWAGDPSRTK